MRPDMLRVSELTPGDLSAWRELAAGAVSPNPFAEPEFVLPATRAWGVDDLRLLVVREGSDWLAALPVRRARSWRGVPGDVIAAWRHDYCFLCTPLVRAVGHAEALATLVRGAAATSPAFSLDWVDADGPLAAPLTAALAAEARVVVVERFERAALHRSETDDYLQRGLSGRHRSGYRRRLKSLEREIGPVMLRDDSDDPEAPGRFLELERTGWKGRAGTAMACDPAHAAFFTEMGQAFAGAGRLRMLSLVCAERPIAMLCDLIARDTVYGFKIAFAEDLGHYSPGMQLQIASTQAFHDSGVARADSCTDPENATMNRLWPDRRALVSVVATRRGPAGAAAHAKWAAAVRLQALRARSGRH
ncbi:MAG TPA: GNAT family N-acetyltransferase [Solirubrobacteraceae bacterium]|nr:GNAT family N-acetyltransferase [Solirubrobacteraceae bacterium]